MSTEHNRNDIKRLALHFLVIGYIFETVGVATNRISETFLGVEFVLKHINTT